MCGILYIYYGSLVLRFDQVFDRLYSQTNTLFAAGSYGILCACCLVTNYGRCSRAGKPGWHSGISFFQLALRRSRSRVTNHNKNKAEVAQPTTTKTKLALLRIYEVEDLFIIEVISKPNHGYNFKSIDWLLNSYLTNANKHVFVLRVRKCKMAGLPVIL